MKIIIYGIDGVMGQLLLGQITKKDNMTCVAGVVPLQQEVNGRMLQRLQGCPYEADVVIDFSHPSNLQDILAYGRQTQTPLLLCTTGYSEADRLAIEHAAQACPILLSTNTSYGVNLINMILQKFIPYLDSFDVEIIEKHHNRKIDAPSGTAKTLYNTIVTVREGKSTPVYGRGLNSGKRQKGEVGFHSVRGGTIAGEHTVLFAGEEELIEIKHTALSRKVFAEGALRAAAWLIKQPPGFYTMQDIFND